MEILLGLDVGDVRIGVALSDELGVAAHPLCTLTRKNRKVDLLAIADLVAIHKVGRIIIGLPVSLDGSIGTQAEKVQKFAQRLEHVIDIPIEFQDESFTTAEAEDVLRELNKDTKEQKELIDEVSAVIILTDYLKQIRETTPTVSTNNT